MEYKWKGSFLGWFQRHTLREADPARLPAQIAGPWGQINWSSVHWGKNIFVLGRQEKPKAGQNLLYQLWRVQRTNQGRAPFICTLLVHICPRFQQSAEATPLCFVHWACRASTREFCPDLAALINPVQKISFHTAHFFTLFVLIAQQPGQAVVPGRLSLNMYLKP